MIGSMSNASVVQMHVGTVCGHTAFAGMEHAASIGTGKRGNNGKVRGYRGRRGRAWSGGHGYLMISEDGVKYHLKKLKNKGLIERVRASRGGYWKVK